MPTEVVMPQMGESITEGTLTKWLKKPGDPVERNEPLFEISTDKVDAEIPSPAAGIMGEIKTPEGSTVQINTVVCTINEAGSAAAAAPAPADLKADSATPAAEATAAQEAAIPAPEPETEVSGGTEVAMPQMGESITEGTITKWLKNIGDTVARDEPIFEISTDKVDAEIPSPVAGTLTEIRVKEGATVTVNTIVAVIGGAAGSKPKAAAPAAVAPAAPAAVAAAPTQASQGETPRSSPLVRKIAGDNNIDLQQVSGSGSAGRITKADIMGHLDKPASTAAATPTTVQPSVSAVQSAPATTAPAKAAAPTQQLGELVPMTKMRSIIAKRMVESKQTSPHVHTVFKVDMTRIVKLREREKNKYEQRNGTKLTYMPFITRAAVQALKKHPVVNAAIQGDAIFYNKNIAIGIAVALEWGLIVPVIKGCEEKNFLGVARSIVDLAERARTKKLAPDEVSGGTFTITNAGIFGEQFGTPIINQPQAAILGVGGLNKEALVLTDKDGQDTIAIRNVQRFTLGFDHRIVDGADAGKFMSDFKAYLENWAEDIG
ncbi:2-oxo acid dehydrogenase subunit E2 [Granulicella tundricola]|uniref:Dihydrolipoamide acetyltransferase component of pyruvate dehydrogenase complex n=1 Tax=Granulicella tundricola (strain ATCC BAA-1859 / DSM 23138 / MP5ACTX9) TaxID=1198114 RepID=E8X455_GRATM|nr:2-oxo acid dehydrogenase subunit E2 [Granulicella tundricola]ADW67115.1 2-oxoglutarate dehydrogenase, E2 component, dihydrolipoamide succinyltransferase [Granulicella tundricola MP5ACTX9]